MCRSDPAPNAENPNGLGASLSARTHTHTHTHTCSYTHSLPHSLGRVLEEDADVDDDVAKLLDGTDGDPDKIREKVCACLSPYLMLGFRLVISWLAAYVGAGSTYELQGEKGLSGCTRTVVC